MNQEAGPKASHLSLNLLVKSAGFYRHVDTSGPVPIFVNKTDSVHVKFYPVPFEKLGLTQGIDFHPVGELDRLCMTRVYLGQKEIYSTAPRLIPESDSVRGEDFGFIMKFNDLELPAPGVYLFHIIFNDVVLHILPLELTQAKIGKHH